MKKLFTLFILCATFSFGQYIKKATLILNDGNKILAKDILISDYLYEYKEPNNPFTNISISKDDVLNVEFDSVDFSVNIPEIKQNFIKNIFPEGIYESLEDLNNKIPTSNENIEGIENGEYVYNNANDLMLFKNINKKELLKTPFAVVYKGDLYFNLKSINELESKVMKVSIPAVMNRFIKIYYENDDYFYSEFIPVKRTSDASLGGMYGAVGGILSSAMTSTKGPGESIPFLLLKSDNKFYQVDNCIKFNQFLGPKIVVKIECHNNKALKPELLRKYLIK